MNARWGLLVAVLLLVTGCRSGSPPPPTDPQLAKVLLDEQPAGFTLARRATGALDRKSASIAIPYADPKASEQLLEEAGFDAASARVWTRDDEFVSVYVYRLDRPFGAQQLVDYALSSLKGRVSANLFPIEGVPSGQSYTLSGFAREGSRDLFCQGSWFARGDLAFNQNICSSSRPVGDSERALKLARAQLAALESLS